ncbi:MAG TPA: IS21-like element helper ATPase IstB [Bacillota bacterium]|nr:IS21-like element helper ATPase IstB [Bacillota bacterium]
MATLEIADELLEALGLDEIRNILPQRLERAANNNMSYSDFLVDLLMTEKDVKRERYIKTRTRLAHFPFVRTIEQFDFSFQPSIDERQVRELANLGFVSECSNVILLGPPVVGKTHLAVALGLEAISRGFGAYFINAHDLIADLEKAQRENRLERRMKVYISPRLLIVDEIGYMLLDQLGATILFQLVTQRYEKGSMILTSNKGFAEWGEIFGDSVLAAAILDRLLHHSTTINIRGESYRLREKRRAGLLDPRTGIPGGSNSTTPVKER